MIGRRFVAYFVLLALVTIVTTVAAEYHFIEQSIEHSVHQNLHFGRSVARFVGGMVSEEGEGMEKLLSRLSSISRRGDSKSLPFIRAEIHRGAGR